ncbi:cryptochrome/photolyase family protein [Methylocucumis oryzae]|uniref:cryptochrome/photolyase family protein n=1 Tax=Methylocucumis oryzae TaxID=1632867 RepID=UPI000A866782|nr:deoxyribodipyrimidine photo-lyase [Methylocucumis oryzae]
MLNSPEQLVKDNGSAYQVFTPFHKRARQLAVANPQPLAGQHFIQPYANRYKLSSIQPGKLTPQPHLVGGRQQSLAILQRIANQASDFNRTELNASSQLSAYLKFGTCSIREAYYAVASRFGMDHDLIRQFYWRDFFTHIAYHFPHVFKQAFNPACNAIAWDNNVELFNLWCQGKTGFPIVDAGMRQLNATGFMPNRLRMITASFLVKDLHISWRWGERYFAQRLMDYDPCLNNGNWQWSASTGCDAQPYFRIFNPWLQQKKFDPNGDYIYQWLPELKPIAITTLHAWYKNNVSCDYPKPIVDHSVASTLSKQRFQAVMQRS